LQTPDLILLLWKSRPPYAPKYLIARISPYVAAAVVVAVPFAAYAISVLYSFYGIGGSFYDAGWSAYLIHEADLQIHNPPWGDNGVSWFNYHISPLFLATSALGRLAPLTRIQFYAAFIGISHTLPAIAVFWLLVSGYRMTRPIPCLAAAFLALLFSFDGLALAIARFPHFTMFIVGTGMMFLVALTLRRAALALLFFLLCLSTREDAGFHLFALLSMLYVLERGQGMAWREQKLTAVFAALAVLYSTGAVVLQHALASKEYSLLVNEYLGYPFFSHVNISSITGRFLGWMAYRRYVVIPAICALIWAIVRRNAYIVLGYVAFVPWGILHLIAARELVGTLPSYYAFPYMFASIWPLITILIQQRHTCEVRSTLEPLCGFALLTAASFTGSQYLHNPTDMALPRGFISPPSIARQAATDRSLVRLAEAEELGTILVDQSVLALVPELYRAKNILSGESHINPDSIIFFAGGFDSAAARKMAARAGLEREYEVMGTPLRVATSHSMHGLEELTVLRPSK
jgi:hypothetical protein